MKKIEMKPGKTIFKAGEPADGLYIVGSGEVGIYFPTNKEMAEPDIILKANEILGEMGVIDTAPRMATAKALTDCIVNISNSDGVTSEGIKIIFVYLFLELTICIQHV